MTAVFRQESIMTQNAPHKPQDNPNTIPDTVQQDQEDNQMPDPSDPVRPTTPDERRIKTPHAIPLGNREGDDDQTITETIKKDMAQ